MDNNSLAGSADSISYSLLERLKFSSTRSIIRDQAASDTLDIDEQRPNDKPMTDLSRQEVDAKLAASEAKMDARIANFQLDIKSGFAEIRADIAKQSGDTRTELANQRGELRTEMANLRTEMHRGTVDLLKWGAGIAFAAVASTVGLLTYWNKIAEKPSIPQAAPTVSAPAASSTFPPPVPATPPAAPK